MVFQQNEQVTSAQINALLEAWQSGNNFQIIGDNLDLLIRTKHMARDKQNTDIHWFLLWAIMDEICDQSLPREPKHSFDSIKPAMCIPNNEDHEKMIEVFTLLWCRIIVKTIPDFYCFS